MQHALNEFVQHCEIPIQLHFQDSCKVIAMNETTIHQVIGIEDSTLIVFYTEAHCWQFRLISAFGVVFGERKLYYTPEAALRAGLE